jgi:hypothetical protein
MNPRGDCGCSGGCEGAPTSYIAAAVVVLLILLFVVYSNNKHKDETYIGHSLADTDVYTSGATLRRLGQVFSSTDQGVQTTVHNVDADGTHHRLRVIMYPLVQA